MTEPNSSPQKQLWSFTKLTENISRLWKAQGGTQYSEKNLCMKVAGIWERGVEIMHSVLGQLSKPLPRAVGEPGQGRPGKAAALYQGLKGSHSVRNGGQHPNTLSV